MVAEPPEAKPKSLSAVALAPQLWWSSYVELFRMEAAREPELKRMFEDAALTDGSTYARRGRGGAAARELHAARVEQAAMGSVAQVRRLRNQRDVPLLVAARSLHFLMTMARSKQWKEEQRLRCTRPASHLSPRALDASSSFRHGAPPRGGIWRRAPPPRRPRPPPPAPQRPPCLSP